MILTVTPNTGLDHVLFLDRLRPGVRNQALASVVSMGGKGADVSLILARMGVASVATGFAAGETGERMRRILEEAGVETAFLPVAGQTRLNTVLLEQETGVHTTICAEGLRVTPDDVAALGARMLGWLVAHAEEPRVVVFAGSWPVGAPDDAYVPLLRAAREQGAWTILDASGRYLAAGVHAPPWALKPNREELESLAGRPIATLDDAVAAARELVAAGVPRVVVSLGRMGVVAVEAGQAWAAEPLTVEAVNPAGAGDAVVAAMALGAEQGWELPRVLREAVAAATAVVVTPGTAELDVDRLPEFRQRVQLRPV